MQPGTIDSTSGCSLPLLPKGATVTEMYRALKQLAHHMRWRAAGETMTTTVLVHEAWLKLRSRMDNTNDRQHFLRLSARTMRQIIVDKARASIREKRNGTHVELSEAEVIPGATSEQTIDLDDALCKLETENAALARVAELHLFAGLSFPEISALTKRAERSIYRDWRFARMFLGHAIFGSEMASLQ